MAISYVSNNIAGSTSLTMPSHQGGDLLLMWAFRDGNTTAPSIPAGWTDLGTNSGNGCSARLGYKIAASGSETSGTWTNASVLACMVYRGTSNIPGAVAFNTGSGTTVTAPALTMQDPSGRSWVAVFGGHENASGNPDPFTGTVERMEYATGSKASGCDTNGGVSSWSASVSDYNGFSDGWQAVSVEVMSPEGLFSRMFQ